ncbi:MAG: hexokinase [Treponema sp.]|nr:hexokinase [Treponema sp.]
MTDTVTSFLSKHRFPLPGEKRSIVDTLLADMRAGLSDPDKAYEDMIPTWMLPPADSPKNESVIVIDAGGTNFRSSLVTFSDCGTPSVSDFRKTSMPGVERELSKREFFDAIADNIDYLKNKASKIGFCFSYSMKITPDGDGIPNAFSKEIKAGEVVGCPVGATLKATLESRGWSKIDHIALINDTVAALLAGAAGVPEGVSYASYIGFILGTGMNAAYIQPEGSFDGRALKKQIVVCESGKAGGFARSDFDEAMDAKSQHKGEYQLEKCCSGAYLGPVALEMLHAAARDALVSEETAASLRALTSLTLIDADRFLYAPRKAGCIADCIKNEADRAVVYELLDALVDRSAWYAANILTACAVQSGEGKDASRPICMLCNGTTFFKTHHLRSRAEGYLEELLWRERGIFYEIVSKDDDITLGTAIAGLS